MKHCPYNDSDDWREPFIQDFYGKKSVPMIKNFYLKKKNLSKIWFFLKTIE
jgi:hypothetical protein